ncbi:MAG: divergent PAP2 family protein [Bacillota bacterium]
MIAALLSNEVLIAALLAWFLAQVLKVPIYMFREKRVDFRWLVSTGGMPSSHTSFVTALSAAVGMAEGLNSPLFAVATVFALIVMYDAAGVRQAAGKQAQVLNKIVDELATRHVLQERRLKELLGHTPVEVLAGALLGITVAVLVLGRK